MKINPFYHWFEKSENDKNLIRKANFFVKTGLLIFAIIESYKEYMILDNGY